MNKRIGPIAATLALAAALLVGSAAPSEAAAPALTLSASSVPVGGTISVTAPDCAPEDMGGNGPTFVYRRADLVLITVTPAGERLAAVGDGGMDNIDVTVPGWVDPADPALVAGRCLQSTYNEDTGFSKQTVAFTYADVPVDVTPGTGARTPALALSRTTAAGGQVIGTTGTGCGGVDYATTILLSGGDLSGRTPSYAVVGSDSNDASPVPSTVVGELTLNDQSNDLYGDGGGGAGGPLEEGDYVAIFLCQAEGSSSYTAVMSAPQLIHVVGTNPSGALMVRMTDGGQVEVSGEGCTSGAPVTVHVDGNRIGSPFPAALDGGVAALQAGDRAGAFLPGDEEDGGFAFDDVVTPEADGTWTYGFEPPTDSFSVKVTADCGDPTTDGFRYSFRYLSEDHTAQIDVDRISPTSSPTGGQVTAHGSAWCGIDRNEMDGMGSTDATNMDSGEHVLTMQLVDRTGTVLSESPAQVVERYHTVSGTVTAPSTPGDYFLVGTCDGERGNPLPYEVFSPATLADAGPAPAEPTTGWPRRGAPETYNGRIGPITLPAMDMGGMDMGGDVAGGVGHPAAAAAAAGTAASTTTDMPMAPAGLGPSELFIDVPRPEGDLAITKMTISLVDAQGNEISAQDAHLHHLVIGNQSGTNPACPGSTFGIPGQIVAAAGAERTVLDTGDGPYGIVVKDSDVWKGVYMLMSRAHVDQQVYLAYDMEYRRDVENVRPLTTYFGSATGCSSFDWLIDGSGTPDVQSTYIPVAKDGLLVGAGAHFHNGGTYADLSDDRGRRLCRSEMKLSDETIGMGDMHGGMDDYPPESYDDDQVIEGISNCQLHERVKAGERLRFDTAYANDRARSGVMGIYTFYVWEGGGPKAPGAPGVDPGPKLDRPSTRPTSTRPATGARPVSAKPRYTG